MRRDEIEKRFVDLANRIETMPGQRVGVGLTSNFQPANFVQRPIERDFREWATEAEAAIASVFPENHPNRVAWTRLTDRTGEYSQVASRFYGIFTGIVNQVKAGYLGTLVDGIRQESEADLLGQADTLIQENYLAAGAVIAGGALETHLKHLVDKHSLTITASHGSITVYNNAIATARKNGNEIYSKADRDQVESWGKMRNDAAHGPGEFKCSKDHVQLMVVGIRQFITRAV